MRQLFISSCIIFSVCSAFLLDSKNPSAYISTKEFRDLMDLILEEKHSRRALAHTVGTLHQEVDYHHATLTQQQPDLTTVYKQLLDSHADLQKGIQNLRTLNQTIQTTLMNDSAEIAELTQKSGYSSAFTAYSPYNTHTSGNVRFTSVVTNIGNDYSSTTGVFTCQYPGLYMFTSHLYNSPSTSYDYVSCYILLNGSSKIIMYSYPYSDYKYYEASNSIVLHLKAGDKVSIGSCSSYTGLYSYSSFSGYLVQSD